MPPKKQQQGPSKKNEEKKKERVIEDKTFGLKNKKGGKQQRFIQQVQHQVKGGGQSALKLEAMKLEEKKKKDSKKDEFAELNKIFKPVAELNKVSKDVDPKSVLCAFFKQGLCHKGNKCKFSHDLAIEHKAQKRNLYVDNRDLEGEGEDSMENWDEIKLNEVVEMKHGEKDKNKPQTAIICKFFLEAVENSKYGWFWECPNSEKCIYRHALPPGYVLKKDKKKLDEISKEDQISLEELIEKERNALSSTNLTKVTLESFLAWKKRKIREKREKVKAAEKQKQSDYKAGKQLGLSGRDLFTFNPNLVTEDDDEADEVRYEAEKEEGEDEVVLHDIDDSMFTIDVDDAVVDEVASGSAVPEAVQFNEDLFDPDEMIDVSESDSETNDEVDQASSSGITNGVADIHLQQEKPS